MPSARAAATVDRSVAWLRMVEPAGRGRLAGTIGESRRGYASLPGSPFPRAAAMRIAIFSFFLISGFCGLLYQVVWLRLAFSHFGIITPVLSVVISVFMLGLALGSWAAGRWVEPLVARTRLSAIYLYALCEVVIAAGAWAVPGLFGVGESLLLAAGEADSASFLFFSALLIAASILPWCTAMGATIPLMMAFIRERDPESTTGFSFLYLANVIGAMCGTLVTAMVLVELFG